MKRFAAHPRLRRGGARLRDGVDLVAQGRLGPEQAMKIARRKAQQLAIAERHDIGVAAVGEQQRELPEKIAAAELNGSRSDPHFDRARGDEIHRIAALALVDDDLVRNREARPQHAGDRAPGLRIERREHRDPADQLLALQAEIECRARLHGAAARPQFALQILIHVLIDDRFGAQSPVSLLFEARRHAGEILHFELTRIGRVLQFQRRDRAIDRAEALVELFRHRSPRAGAEYFLDLIAVERDHVLQHETGRQLDLEPVAEQPRERPGDAEPVMDRPRQAQGPC